MIKRKKRKKKSIDTSEEISLTDLDLNKTEVEKFMANFEAICSICSEIKDKNTGFYWDYYVPFYTSLNDEGFLETFSYLMFYSTDEKYVHQWIENNPTEIDKFYSWVKNYEWK